MRLMSKTIVVATTIAPILQLTGAAAPAQVVAQGVAPGGGIGNSTGIGSGIGGPLGGTQPQYPNGTRAPTLAPPPPPGGYGDPVQPSSALSTVPRSSYAPPRVPSGTATVPLSVPNNSTNDLSFLNGCWRTDVFQFAHQAGFSTWCFDDKGVGRFMHNRLGQPNYVCHAQARASYGAQQLRLHRLETSCSDGRDVSSGDLVCRPNGADGAQCTGNAFADEPANTWTVRLYRVP